MLMNNSNAQNRQSQYPNLNDEIDMMEFWAGKWIIVGVF